MKPAIIEQAITQFVADGRHAVVALREAEAACVKLEAKLTETRSSALLRRLELGFILIKARACMPARGTRENGWLSYLEAIGLDDSTAHRYIELAKSPNTAARSQEGPVRSSESGERPDAPPTGDADAPVASSDEVQAPEPDRNSWCTPKLIADAIGPWDLDPCSNERSHIKATRAFRLDRDEDGLELANAIDEDTRVFVNPPYSSGQVLRWVKAYAHTRFCFLVKIDPSTEWFRELHDRTAIILAPIGERIEFEPPPGVSSSGGVQFPHGLFFAREQDASDHIKRLCFIWKTINAA